MSGFGANARYRLPTAMIRGKSYGLFGDQGVFRREATGAAQVVAGRFGSGAVNVQYNSKKGGGATIESLAISLQVAAKGMDAENDVLFLILTSHGSRDGLVVKAGRLTQTLTPSNLADMLARVDGIESLDTAALDENIEQIYGLGYLDLVRYEVVDEDGKSGVIVHVAQDALALGEHRARALDVGQAREGFAQLALLLQLVSSVWYRPCDRIS